jgi:hypothetical protein
MNLSEFNQRYEAIIHSRISSSLQDRKLADLMTEMEVAFKIADGINEVWEKEMRKWLIFISGSAAAGPYKADQAARIVMYTVSSDVNYNSPVAAITPDWVGLLSMGIK